MSKTWFITGASRGFGKAFAAAALSRGDAVAATVRAASSVSDLVASHPDSLKVYELDVTDATAAKAAVADAHAHFGRLDVVVNNAGFGHFGAIEEVTEAEARAQMDTNLFGALWVSQAALPLMRAQGSGHIVQISSIGGVGAFPTLGLYHASKWALEGFSESMAQEVAPFGIKVTLVEPGPFSTDWAGDSAFRSQGLPAYEPLKQAMAKRSTGSTGGSAEGAAAALLQVVDADKPPLRILFGALAANTAPALYEQRLKTWAEWDAVGRSADGS